MGKIKKILLNKVLLYVSTRYIVYGLQFISLILIASKLGSHNYGKWGFILLILNYMNIINLGIPNSVNVLIVQNKTDFSRIKNYIASSFSIIGILIFLLLVIGIVYRFYPLELFNKFDIGSKFYIILIIGALQYINVLMVNIFRASNRLIEVALYQSSIPLGVFTVAIIFNGDRLITALIWTYLLMHSCSLLLFLFRGKEYWGGTVTGVVIIKVLKKGFLLFIYNACFYLIVTTTSTFVSRYYTVSEYGDFSFSYTLGHSILLLMEAFMYVMFPKVIDKLYSGNDKEVDITIKAIRTNYISLAYCLIFFAMAIFPLFLKVLPGFKSSLITLNFMILAIVLSTNSFGYNTLLIARNKEKLSSMISGIILLINLAVCWCMVYVFKIPYYYIPLSICLSYFLFAVVCCYFGWRILDRKLSIIHLLLSVTPVGILIPYIIALIIAYIDIPYLSCIPFILYCCFNKTTILEIFDTVKRIINNPKIVDITK